MDPTQALSMKLLEGWTMLAESCPICLTMPLTEQKHHKKITCTSCNRYFTRENGSFIESHSPLANGNNQSSSGNAAVPSKSNKDDTMEIDEDEDFDYHPPTKEEVERFEARRKKQDEVSKRIGDKLLAGWAMLDLVCPKGECGTVLMRDRSKKMWCLACNTMVITEDEFDATKHRIVTNTEVIANTGNQNSKTPASQGMATPPVQQPEPARNQIPIIQQIPELQQLLQQPQQIPVQQQASPQQQFAGSAETDIVKYAVSTLFNKLKQVSTQLACTNDPVMCAHYANAMKEISIALANLQQLRSTL